MEEYDVVIVGGGFTGVSTALHLHEYNEAQRKKPECDRELVSFLLIEGDDTRLGGRAFSEPVTWQGPDGKQETAFFEQGAQYIGDKQSEIWSWVQKAIKDGAIPEDSLVDGYAARLSYKEQVMKIAGHRYEYDRDKCLFGIGGVPPDLGVWDIMGSLVFIQLIEAMERMIDVKSPQSSPEWILKYDQITLADWIDSFDFPPGATALMRISVEAVISVSAQSVSAFYFFWYCACNRGFLNLVNDEQGGPQQYYLRCGFSNLIDSVADKFKGSIRLGHRVTAIHREGHSSSVICDVAGTVTTIRAKRVICATTPAAISSIEFDPALPPEWQRVSQEKMGTTLKCKHFFKSPWWRNVESTSAESDANAYAPHYTGYCGANDSPVIWVMDYSPPGPPPAYENQGCYCLMTFTVDQFARTLSADPNAPVVKSLDKNNPHDNDRIMSFVTPYLNEMLNDSRALSTSPEYEPGRFIWHRWADDNPLIPGGPNTVFLPKILTDCADLFNKPVHGVYFACAELCLRDEGERQSPLPIFLPFPQNGEDGLYSDWRQSLGYVDGAIVAGQGVGEQVLEDLGLIRETVSGRIEDLLGDGVSKALSLLQNLLLGSGQSDPVDVSPLQAEAALKQLCTAFYEASKPDFDALTAGSGSAPEKRQEWVMNQLLAALGSQGLVPEAPVAPGGGSWSLSWLFDQVNFAVDTFKWQNQVVEALSSFIRTGYRESCNSESKISSLSDIVQAMMGVLSLEPFVGASEPGEQSAVVSPTTMLRKVAGLELPALNELLPTWNRLARQGS